MYLHCMSPVPFHQSFCLFSQRLYTFSSFFPPFIQPLSTVPIITDLSQSENRVKKGSFGTFHRHFLFAFYLISCPVFRLIFQILLRQLLLLFPTADPSPDRLQTSTRTYHSHLPVSYPGSAWHDAALLYSNQDRSILEAPP